MPATVSIEPSRDVMTPHQSTAARSPSTTGSPNRQSASAWSSNAQRDVLLAGSGGRGTDASRTAQSVA